MLKANRRELPANPGGAPGLIEINAAVQRTMLRAIGRGCSRLRNSINPNSTNLNEEITHEQEETKNGRDLSQHCRRRLCRPSRSIHGAITKGKRGNAQTAGCAGGSGPEGGTSAKRQNAAEV